MSLELERVDMNKTVQDVLANLKAQITESGAKFITKNLPPVFAHPDQMYQLMFSLIENTLQYRGTHPPNVMISASEIEGQWTFRIIDDGVGMEPSFLDQIFDRFHRFDNCKKIVRQYGGRIWAISAPGKGSTFYFTLPSPQLKNLASSQN